MPEINVKMAAAYAVSNDEFDRVVKFSLRNVGYNFKTRTVGGLETAVVQHNREVLVVLPTGYGKSLIYHLLPKMFNFLFHGGNSCSIAIIVSPLTALMLDKVEKIKKQG